MSGYRQIDALMTRLLYTPILYACGIFLAALAPTSKGQPSFHQHYSPEGPELLRAAHLRANLHIDLPIRETAFLNYGINKSRGYMEFGAGGVTVAACLLMRPVAGWKFFVVDSEEHFAHSGLDDNKCIQEASRIGTGNVKLISVGPVDATGFPTNSKNQKGWRRYAGATALWAGESIDTVFVGGRFRVAAIASSLLYFPGASVYLYEFRKYVADIEDIVTFVQHCDGLFRLTRKPDVDNSVLRKKMENFMMNPN